jgi:O-antigen/teichoic acid export membrane protein
MICLLAKIGTPEMVGQFALAVGIAAPVLLFANLNLRTVQATDVRGHYAFGDYLSLRLVALMLAVLVTIGGVVAAGWRLQLALLVVMTMVAKGIDAVTDVIYGLLQQHERMDRIAISQMIQGTLQLVAMGVVVGLTGSLFWGTVGTAIASALCAAGYSFPTAARIARNAPEPWRSIAGTMPARGAGLGPRWSTGALVGLARMSMPLGIAASLGSLSANVPRYFIQGYLGERDLGVFTAMWSLMLASGMATASILQSTAPRLARYYIVDGTAFKRLTGKLIALAAVSGVIGVGVAVFFGRPLLTALYRPQYAANGSVLGWLMAVAGLQHVASVLGAGITAARQFDIQLWVYAGMLLINVILCAWFVPHHGLQGAAWGLLGSTSFWLVCFSAIFISLVRTDRPRN